MFTNLGATTCSQDLNAAGQPLDCFEDILSIANLCFGTGTRVQKDDDVGAWTDHRWNERSLYALCQKRLSDNLRVREVKEIESRCKRLTQHGCAINKSKIHASLCLDRNDVRQSWVILQKNLSLTTDRALRALTSRMPVSSSSDAWIARLPFGTKRPPCNRVPSPLMTSSG